MPNPVEYFPSQVVFRETGIKRGDRKLMLFVGLVALSEDTAIKGEHQYFASVTEDEYGVPFFVMTNTASDLSSQLRGLGAAGILQAPIWRV